MHYDYNEDYKTKYEFKDSVLRHAEIVFEWQGVEYGIFWIEGNKWVICLSGSDNSKDVFYDNIDDVMNHKIGDDKLIDICTKLTVIERTF